ncbi:GNAT family N-acetyltransferase [Brevibacillus composti]|uniref:GNAT family N-acetyltransferase n=1 Tax=Brevibacillus composti TaxID=2796470 RepID=A0A7T5EQ38_9BACL|nr:GNAT family N-acetyltransferase [Brevibacillus composti]QQE76721.1 GNAT family N-acetyltransferase [Brevibacillus composti]QUO43789.1 GNAT family N-acetyltransferase [Brevibacillus composti]
MISIKRFPACTLDEITMAWNRGFEGYYFPITMTVETMMQRLGTEGYTSSLSVVAFADGEPVGLAASGVRTVGGKKIAWNGGTGVKTEYRRQGVGRKLMEATLDLYREEGVHLATLEAVSQNDKAIALYRQLGYEIKDRLLFWQHTEPFVGDPFGDLSAHPYRIRRGIPQEAAALSFYPELIPWQNQWQSLRDGEAIFAEDPAGEVVGYVLFRRTFDEEGKLASITLRQCACQPERSDREEIVRVLLGHAYAPLSAPCRRGTFNLPASEEWVLRVLEQAGFAPSGTEQVYMVRPMEA